VNGLDVLDAERRLVEDAPRHGCSLSVRIERCFPIDYL
jgi:hypothetical protein